MVTIGCIKNLRLATFGALSLSLSRFLGKAVNTLYILHTMSSILFNMFTRTEQNSPICCFYRFFSLSLLSYKFSFLFDSCISFYILYLFNNRINYYYSNQKKFFRIFIHLCIIIIALFYFIRFTTIGTFSF